SLHCESQTEESVCLGRLRCRLTSLGLGAFFQGRFTRKLYATLVIDPDTLDPNHVANFGDVLRSFHPEIRELRNVHEPVSARENLHKRAKFLHRNDAALVSLSNLDFSGHAAHDFFGALHALAAGRINVDL